MSDKETNRLEALIELLADVAHHVKWCEREDPGSAQKSLRALQLEAHHWMTALQLGMSIEELKSAGPKDQAVL